jgi:Beta-lactamase
MRHRKSEAVTRSLALLTCPTRSGGIYSTANDLADLARNILLSTQLPPSVTRRWLKPMTHTSALTFSVGAPWEIYRTKSNITTGRTIDVYTKSGGIGSYTSLLILIPDYDVSLAVLAAGSNGIVVNYVAEMVVQTLIPILEQSARDEAAKILTGLYISETGDNSSISLNVDNGPGLVIERWISNGSNLLNTAEDYLQASSGAQVRSVRLYPTGLKDWEQCKTRAAYRAVFDISTQPDTTSRVFDQNVNTWETVDEATYGEISVDDFIFEFDSGSAVKYIEPRVLRSRLVKVQT